MNHPENAVTLLLDTEIPFAAANGEELFAIGDIHGRLDLLDRALDEIAATPRLAGYRRTLVFLGDLIDRGPNSIGCIDAALSAESRVRADRVVYLMGNHEQMLATALASDEDLAAAGVASIPVARTNALGAWLINGGHRIVAGQQIGDLPAIVGPERISWLRALKTAYASGTVAFIHAGLPPGLTLPDVLRAPPLVDIEKLDENRHFAWVRGPFLVHQPEPGEGHAGHFVVHGHTIPDYEAVTEADAQATRARINLDGGSFKTGKARFAHIVDSRLRVYELTL
jgi:serine/threonine protein phosphatase 1